MKIPDFGDVYTQYFSDVYKYVLSLSCNETIAEEVTQQTFFKAMQHIDQFNGSCKILKDSVSDRLFQPVSDHLN